VKIAITGASGLVGSALVPALRGGGHDVVRLVRRAARASDEIGWDPAARRLDPTALADVDAVVHLAGVGIGDRRWTDSYKRTVLASRIDGTTTVSDAIAMANPRPRALLSASAIGWYGDTGERAVDEGAESGQGFLAEVCRRWEGATAAATEAGVRVVHLRSGLILAPRGGLLGRLRPLFALGVGGRLASGRQYWSWISLADEVGAIRFLLEHDIVGPVNLTGPEPVTNAQFARALGRVLHRPATIPVPAFALRIVAGGFADEGIVVGQRVLPRVLTEAQYPFQHGTVEDALRWATGRQ
jgi:uncharacterized protein